MAAQNLPQYTTRFIGRASEITEIAERLDDPTCHLLTLVGPGGIGKTRLALEIVSHLAMKFVDGVYFVPLQPLQEVNNIVTAIVDVLPLQLMDNDNPQRRLLEYLREKHLLLVLDNFEHLLAGVDIVTDILNATTRVQLLITSRERLSLQAEHVWPVTGLNVPVIAEDMSNGHSAVQLFAERARRVQPYFSLETQKEDVVRICQLVDGLPLALELAAAWTRVLDCKTIADEVQRNIDVLISNQHDLPERHQSMRAVFDHSWRLLTEQERDVLPRLAVFRGGFTMDAARHVAGASLHTLASLIDKSLVQLSSDGRYDLHELLRQHAGERLAAVGAGENTYDAHSVYFAGYMHVRIEDLKGRRQIEAMAEIRADFENVRTAWNRAVERKYIDRIEQIIDGLWLFCELNNREQAGYGLFQYAERRFAPERDKEPGQLWGRLLARAYSVSASENALETALQIAQRYSDPAELAFCRARMGSLAYRQHEHHKARQMLEQSLALYQEIGDRYAIADVLYQLIPRHPDETWADRKHYGEESLRLRREIGDRIGTAWSLAVAALNEGGIGHFAEAERLWLERIAVGQEIGNNRLIAMGHAQISHKVYFFTGDFAQARASAEQALMLGNMSGNSVAIGWSTVTLGLLACMDEDYAEGKRLCQQGAAAASSAGSYTEIATLANWGVSIAWCGLGDYEAASSSLLEVLRYLPNLLGTVGTIVSLPIAAIILAHRGQTKRAVELLALAFTHPVGASGWMKKWPLLDRLQTEMELTIGFDTFSASWERGKQEYLNDVIIELQAQFSNMDISSLKEVSQPLPDPLSPRELEVLVLLAHGLTNHEIAEQLVVGVSTVKKHINHIYDKLDVKNRTGAVARARELRLLE